MNSAKKSIILGLMALTIGSMARASFDVKLGTENTQLSQATAATVASAGKSTLEDARQTKEAHAKQAKRPFDLVEPITPYKCNAVEKISLFRLIASAASKNTKQLYHMAQDPVIKVYAQDYKTMHELRLLQLTDEQGITMLEHGIENNDAPFVSRFSKDLNVEERQSALRYAAQKENLGSFLHYYQPKHKNQE